MLLLMGLNEANKKTWVKEIMIYQVSNASSGCVLSTTQLETRTNTQFFLAGIRTFTHFTDAPQ